MPGSKPGLLLNTTNLDLLSEMAISFSHKVHSKNQFIQLPGISVTISLPSANKFIAPLLLRFVCRKIGRMSSLISSQYSGWLRPTGWLCSTGIRITWNYSSGWMRGVAMSSYTTLFNNGLTSTRYNVSTGCRLTLILIKNNLSVFL